MLFNFNGKKLFSLNKEEIKEGEKTIDLKEACVRALTMPHKDDIEGNIKFKLYCMAQKIKESTGEIEITHEDMSTIKDRIGKLFYIEVVGSCYQYLENKEKK